MILCEKSTYGIWVNILFQSYGGLFRFLLVAMYFHFIVHLLCINTIPYRPFLRRPLLRRPLFRQRPILALRQLGPHITPMRRDSEKKFHKHAFSAHFNANS